MKYLITLVACVIALSGCSATYKNKVDSSPTSNHIYLATKVTDTDNFYIEIRDQLRANGYRVDSQMTMQPKDSDAAYLVGFWYGSAGRFTHDIIVDVFELDGAVAGDNIARATYRAKRGDFIPTFRSDIPDIIVKSISDIWHSPE